MKHRFLKLCSTVLVLALFANMLPMGVLADTLSQSLSAQ